MSKAIVVWMVFSCVALCTPQPAHAQTVTWSGFSWKLTSGHMAGVALGNPANITIDAHGYLHLRIVRQNEKWTASELFTRSEEHTSELQSPCNLVCRLLLEKKKRQLPSFRLSRNTQPPSSLQHPVEIRR